MLRSVGVGRSSIGLHTLRSAPTMRSARSISFYKLFPKTLAAGPPPKGPFSIDPKALRQEYLQVQQQVHPDTSKQVGKIDAATISTAYKALLDPLQRAQHILSLRGIDSLGEDVSLQDEDMLMTIMMIREEVAECEDEETRKELSRQNEERISACVDKLDKAFANDELEKAQKLTIELSYWVKLKQTLEA